MAPLRLLNLLALFGVIGAFMYLSGNVGSQGTNPASDSFDASWEAYGWCTILLYLVRYLVLLALPQALANFFSFLLYNPFPKNPVIEVISTTSFSATQCNICPNTLPILFTI